jgi:hypothetical protein
MKQAEVKAVLKASGWQEDKWGNFRTASGKMRCKLQATSMRIERQVEHAASEYSPASKSWVNIVSDYYCNMSVTERGGLRIKSMTLKQI